MTPSGEFPVTTLRSQTDRLPFGNFHIRSCKTESNSWKVKVPQRTFSDLYRNYFMLTFGHIWQFIIQRNSNTNTLELLLDFFGKVWTRPQQSQKDAQVQVSGRRDKSKYEVTFIVAMIDCQLMIVRMTWQMMDLPESESSVPSSCRPRSESMRMSGLLPVKYSLIRSSLKTHLK